MDILAYVLAKKYTNDTADSLGSLKGAPATIKSIEDIDGGHRVTFEWTGTSGTKQTQTLDVMDGEQGPQGEPGPQGEQGPAGPQGEKGADGTMSFDDLTPEQKASLKGDPGEKGDTGEKGADGAKGDKGDDGYSPTITVTEITGGHRVTVTDAEGSESFDVMDGQGGQADSVDWSKVANKPDFATVATSGSYNDLSDKPTIPSAYDDTAITGRVSAVETALGGHTVGENVPSDAVFTDTVYDDTALSARVTANANAIADRYTKTETDAKIAEAMTDVDNEHFHVVTALPPVADAKENHEYVLVTYEQDGTTIATEEHYLFYDGAFHSRPTQISLDGYATEQYVDDAFTQHVKTDVPVNAVFTDTVYDDTALAARVTGVENQFNTRNYTFADILLLDVDLPHTMPWNEFSAMGFPQSTYQENTVYNVVTFNSSYDKEYPKIRYFNDSQEGAIKTIRYKLDERQSSASSEETLVVEYDIANQTATITTGGMIGVNKSHIKVYSPRSVYGVSGKVSEDFDLRVLEEAATHGEVASGVAEAKAYADGKALVTQTGWGVVTTGRGEIGSAGNPKVIDVSQYNFTSADDYEVAVTSLNNNCNVACTAKTATSFTVVGSGWGQSVGERPFSYVLTAKGYGAVAYTGEIPTGGTTGQVLTKRSDADGDYGWQNKLPSYVADRPEGSTPASGNVVQVGSFVNTDGAEYGIYEFYYRTSALPAADATKVFPLTPLLDDYTIFDFIDATGVTGNGHFIGSGRTDGTNRIIVQQFSKNNKTFTMRAYGDYTAQTALLRIKFIGTKNA